MHPCTSSVVPEHFQETNKRFRTFLFSRYVVRGAKPGTPYHIKGVPVICALWENTKKLENVLPNKYYVLTSFLTDFCTNPLCPKRVAIFLQWNGELTVIFHIVRDSNIEYIDYHICLLIDLQRIRALGHQCRPFITDVVGTCPMVVPELSHSGSKVVPKFQKQVSMEQLP